MVLSRPYCSTSASVHIPGGISCPGSRCPRFCDPIVSDRQRYSTNKPTHLMPFTKLDRPRIRPPLLANHRIRQISTPRVNYNPLLLLRHLGWRTPCPGSSPTALFCFLSSLFFALSVMILLISMLCSPHPLSIYVLT